LLADDLIDEVLLPPGVDGSMLTSGVPDGGSDFREEGWVGNVDSDGLMASGKPIPKFGVFVEIGKLGELESCFVFSSLLEGDELKPADGVLASGGSAVLVEGSPPLGRLLGNSRGAGCKAVVGGFGSASGGTVGSDGDIVVPGKALVLGLEANPLEGVLLNMSNALDALPDALGAMGLGPETSGNVSSRPTSNSAMRGVSVPFMAT